MSMTDRELLELAAKAAGYRDFSEGNFAAYGKYSVGPDEQGRWIDWNPLHDDGDALRLAVKLGILILTARGFAVANSRDSGGTVERLLSDPDPHAATRRAIVRAAAAIGSAA